MAKRVFVSFDYDHDLRLKDFIVGQAKNPDSPFEICDWSMKEAEKEADWKDKARRRIKNCELVIVMVGPYTHNAPGVLAEVKMAREEGKRVVQIIGYRDGQYKPVDGAGILYSWNWENLKKLLA